MHRRHGYPWQTQKQPSRPRGQLFTPRLQHHAHSLSLGETPLAALLEKLESLEPLHIDENNEWSVS